MPSGVVKYTGSRGVVWRIRYVDAGGQQVQETLGAAADGWTRRRAASELRDRLQAVEREGYRRPEPVTFASFAHEWLADYPERKGLKSSTVRGYRGIVDGHLIPVFGSGKVADVDVDRVERYVAGKRRKGLGPRTVNRHLNVLSLILNAAVRRRLIAANPVGHIDRPPEPRRRWRILSPVEIRAVEKALDEMIEAADPGSEERAWRETVRVVFLVNYGTGLRLGELLGLRWRAVRLADPEGASLRVEETLVRGRVDTPKSERGERTIALGPRLADELFQHRARTAYDGDDERVFVSPHRGCALNPKRYAKTLRDALTKAGIVDYVRPTHDGRHSSITNAAAAGTAPAALMARAGHSDFKTTQGYIDLAGETFREEAQRLERRLWGGEETVAESAGYKIEVQDRPLVASRGDGSVG
jgi:integrase